MRVSLFNCRTGIWYVLKNQCVNYCNYHLKQLMTGKYMDWKVLKKLKKQA